MRTQISVISLYPHKTPNTIVIWTVRASMYMFACPTLVSQTDPCSNQRCLTDV